MEAVFGWSIKFEIVIAKDLHVLRVEWGGKKGSVNGVQLLGGVGGQIPAVFLHRGVAVAGCRFEEEVVGYGIRMFPRPLCPCPDKPGCDRIDLVGPLATSSRCNVKTPS